jgi:hypothetical protein
LSSAVTGTHGDTAGTATVHYADGGSRASPVAAPDWFTGTTGVAVVSAWRNTTGGRQYHQVNLYRVSVPLAAGRTVTGLTLPNVGAGTGVPELHVFAVAVRPAAPGWAGSWAAATDDGLVDGPWTNRTLRMVEHTSVAGGQLRIRLDNDFATVPATVGHVTVAVQSSAAAATAAPVSVTFRGNRQVTLPAGGQAVSDPVAFAAPADANLLVSLYLPGTVATAPLHSLGMQDTYSTADGAGATYNGNDRWPNDLAHRLLTQLNR